MAQLLGELTGARPDRTVIYGVGEGALRMLGSVGTAGRVVRAWTTVPLVLDIPLCASAKERRPVFLESGVEMEREYPAIRGGREGTEAWASIPVVEEGQVVGVVGLSWQEPRTFDPATRERIIHAVGSAGHALVRSLKAGAAELSMLNELLDLIPDPWLALRSTEGQGTPTFIVEGVAPNLPQTWLGAPLLDLFPDIGDDRRVADRPPAGAPSRKPARAQRQRRPGWEPAARAARCQEPRPGRRRVRSFGSCVPVTIWCSPGGSRRPCMPSRCSRDGCPGAGDGPVCSAP